jgi:membrane protease subunit HflK
MAWNEPGNNERDPWGGGGRNQGPPDLDELIKKLSGKFGGLFGGPRGGDSGSNGSGGGTPGAGGAGGGATSRLGVGLLAVIVAGAWLASGFYIVDEGRRGVVLRFGAYAATTTPGINWHFPYPIEKAEVVDVERRRFVEIGYRSGSQGRPGARSVDRESLMLTQDENIVDVGLSVQYQISSPRDYLFNVLEPDETLKQVVESATREVIGKSKMDFVLTEGRSEIVARIEELSQETLEKYQAGLQIVNVNLQDAQPPEEVQASFADAIKAREDEQRFKNEAEAYANEIVPRARGAAARQLEEAEAYRQQVIAESEGEAQRFENLLVEYLRAPSVTRERLYLESMEQVLGNSRKIIVDAKDGNNLLYLPLDKMIDDVGGSGSGQRPTSGTPQSVGAAGVAQQRLRDPARDRNSSRNRGDR